MVEVVEGNLEGFDGLSCGSTDCFRCGILDMS